jgi:hypothetical protein
MLAMVAASWELFSGKTIAYSRNGVPCRRGA